jgi:hypothetical protein
MQQIIDKKLIKHLCDKHLRKFWNRANRCYKDVITLEQTDLKKGNGSWQYRNAPATLWATLVLIKKELDKRKIKHNIDMPMLSQQGQHNVFMGILETVGKQQSIKKQIVALKKQKCDCCKYVEVTDELK